MRGSFRSATAALAIFVGAAASSSVAEAAVFIFTSSPSGDFSLPNDVLLFSFTVAAPTQVTIETFNYHPGSDSDPPFGDAGAATGGFDPIITLFDSAGGFITDFRSDIDSPTNLDARVQEVLDPFTYYFSLTQFDNFFDDVAGANLFSMPTFLRQGNPGYTTDGTIGFACSNEFTDANCGQRNAKWTVGIDGATTASIIPIPAALPLLATALTALGLVGWFRRT